MLVMNDLVCQLMQTPLQTYPGLQGKSAIFIISFPIYLDIYGKKIEVAEFFSMEN
jgi:hypothetical protein